MRRVAAVSSVLISITLAPALLGVRNQVGGGHHHGRRADHQEDMRRGGGMFGFLHHAVGQRFAEPDHVGTRQSRRTGNAAEVFGSGARRSGQLAPQTVQRIRQISPCSLRILPLPARS